MKLRAFAALVGLMAVSIPAAFAIAVPQPVPEPATLGLIAAGVGAISMLRRRK